MGQVYKWNRIANCRAVSLSYFLLWSTKRTTWLRHFKDDQHRQWQIQRRSRPSKNAVCYIFEILMTQAFKAWWTMLTLHSFADQKKSEKYIGKQKQQICALFVGLCGGFNIKSFKVKYPYLKLCPDTPTHWKVLLCGSSEVTAGQSYPGQS